MNGTSRLGVFLCFVGGVTVANGFDAVSTNLWGGIVVILAGAVMDVIGIDKVGKGIREAIHLNNLERKAGLRK